MGKKIKSRYKDPNIYDGYCATVYEDGTFKLRDHWAVNRLSLERKAKLSQEIQAIIHDELNPVLGMEKKRTSKMPLGWHRNNLKNLLHSLEWARRERDSAQKDYEQIQSNFIFYQHQIEEAEKEGRDSFDRERFRLTRT